MPLSNTDSFCRPPPRHHLLSLLVRLLTSSYDSSNRSRLSRRGGKAEPAWLLALPLSRPLVSLVLCSENVLHFEIFALPRRLGPAGLHRRHGDRQGSFRGLRSQRSQLLRRMEVRKKSWQIQPALFRTVGFAQFERMKSITENALK